MNLRLLLKIIKWVLKGFDVSNFHLPSNRSKFDCANFGFYVGAYFNFTSKIWNFKNSNKEIRKGQYLSHRTDTGELLFSPTKTVNEVLSRDFEQRKTSCSLVPRCTRIIKNSDSWHGYGLEKPTIWNRRHPVVEDIVMIYMGYISISYINIVL